MNLLTGLLGPTRGTLSVLGHEPRHPDVFRHIGYCSQFDAFPRGATGFQFVAGYLRLFGYPEPEVKRRAWAAIERVQLVEAAKRRVAGYSKGMRQRIKLAQAMAHEPQVLVLDEPLNGLDPMARAEFGGALPPLRRRGPGARRLEPRAARGRLSSPTSVVLVHGGYVVAEGAVPEGVRGRAHRPSAAAGLRALRAAGAARRARLSRRGPRRRGAPRRPQARVAGRAPRAPSASTCCSTASPARARSTSRRCCRPTTTCSRSTST
jgi:ABC-type lipopolysaccharide export system ATPase subunit